MISAILTGLIHALLYAAMTLGLGAWLLASDTSDDEARNVQPIGQAA